MTVADNDNPTTHPRDLWTSESVIAGFESVGDVYRKRYEQAVAIA